MYLPSIFLLKIWCYASSKLLIYILTNKYPNLLRLRMTADEDLRVETFNLFLITIVAESQ